MHAIILPAAFVVSLYAHNIQRLSPEVLVIPLTVMSLSAAAVVAVLWVFVRRAFRKATLLLSLSVLLAMSYGIVFKALGKGELGFVFAGVTVGTNSMLFVAWSILFALGCVAILRCRRSLQRVQTLANIVAATLLILPSVQIIAYELPRAQRHRLRVGREVEELGASREARRDKQADIYYLIFDRYAGNSVLRKMYAFDNEPFLKALEKRGFFVALDSTANYLKTAHSLASSLNMEYIDYLSAQEGHQSSDWTPLFKLLQDYKVWRFLRARGYRFIHLGSWWGPTSRNKFADRNVNTGVPRNFPNTLFRSTVLYPVVRKLYGYDWKKEQHARVLAKFETLGEIPTSASPKFVFAHFLLPHRPYVFSPEGEYLLDENRPVKERYVDQLRFANKKIIQLVDQIIKRSEIRPIIILQSDEGPFPVRYQRDVPGFDWRSATNDELKEKLGILNAYYVSDHIRGLLYRSITPVNTFRLIFNKYFDTTYKMLNDDAFAFVNEEHLYQFFKVTERVR